MGIRCADHVIPLYPQKLALTSPTGGGRSVGIVSSRTKTTEFFFTTGMGTAVSNKKANLLSSLFRTDITWATCPLNGPYVGQTDFEQEAFRTSNKIKWKTQKLTSFVASLCVVRNGRKVKKIENQIT